MSGEFKRLAPKNSDKFVAKQSPLVQKEQPLTRGKSSTTDNSGLQLVNISDKAFVVIGYNPSHCPSLLKLGGKLQFYTYVSQEAWMFANYKRKSVENYINTGEIVMATFAQDANTPPKNFNNQKPIDKSMLELMFQEFREAFDKDAEYDGSSIMSVIDQLQLKYMPKNVDISKEKKSWLSKIPPVKNIKNDDGQLDSEDE